MVKRILDAVASDFLAMSASELKQSIVAGEGRTVAVEVICSYQSPIEGVSHGEIAAAMGADILFLDRYDCLNPAIRGVDLVGDKPLSTYKQQLGRPIGVNMIVADSEAGMFLEGRLVNMATVERVILQGRGYYLFV